MSNWSLGPLPPRRPQRPKFSLLWGFVLVPLGLLIIFAAVVAVK